MREDTGNVDMIEREVLGAMAWTPRNRETERAGDSQRGMGKKSVGMVVRVPAAGMNDTERVERPAGPRRRIGGELAGGPGGSLAVGARHP